MAIKEEKKIIVGKIPKATVVSIPPSIGARPPKSKALPALVKPIILLNTALATSNIGRPIGVTKIKVAKKSCKPTPIPTKRQSTRLRWLDINQATPIKTKIPIKETSRSNTPGAATSVSFMFCAIS